MNDAFQKHIDSIGDREEYSSISVPSFRVLVDRVSRGRVSAMGHYISEKLKKEDVEVSFDKQLHPTVVSYLIVKPKCNQDRYVWFLSCEQADRRISVTSQINDELISFQETSYLTEVERIVESSLVELYEKILRDIRPSVY